MNYSKASKAFYFDKAKAEVIKRYTAKNSGISPRVVDTLLAGSIIQDPNKGGRYHFTVRKVIQLLKENYKPCHFNTVYKHIRELLRVGLIEAPFGGRQYFKARKYALTIKGKALLVGLGRSIERHSD